MEPVFVQVCLVGVPNITPFYIAICLIQQDNAGAEVCHALKTVH